MKKFFKFGKSKKDGSGSASGSTESLAATGYLVKEKDLSKLHKAAWTGDLGKVKQLAKKDPNALDKENRSPLHMACARGHAAVVQELIEWKAKVNVGDNDARTPLIKAVECGHEDCARILLDANADPNTSDRNRDAPLHYAGRAGSVPLTKLLLGPDRTDIDLQNKDGHTPLHLAVIQRYDKLVELLLDEGSDPNMQDADGRTPLMHTCQDGTKNLTDLLLDYQADTQIKDAKGWTADDIAIMANHEECRLALGTASMRRLQAASAEGAAPAHKSPAKGAVGGSSEIFGGPALNQMDDSLAVEESHSKISEAAGGDSWGDTDEESEILDPKRKKSIRVSTVKSKAPTEEDITEGDEELKDDEKVPNLDLRHLRDANESWDDQDVASKITRLNNASAVPSSPQTLGVQRNDSNTSKSHIPVAKKDSGDIHPPVSARSSMSVRSVLSYGNADSNWSDDESLFSSSNDPKNKKSAPLLQPKAEGEEDLGSEGGDTLAIDVADTKRKNSNAIPLTPRGSGINQDADDSVGAPLASSTARSHMGDKEKTETELAKERHQRMLADLGLSDVSDISNPDFGDDSPPLSSQRSLQYSISKPPPAPKRFSSTGDDWDTDTSRGVKQKVPLSTRSSGSNWDSPRSTAEEHEKETKPGKPNIAALMRGKQASQEDDAQAEVRKETDIEGEPERSSGHGGDQQKRASEVKCDKDDENESQWDSDTELGDTGAGYMLSRQSANNSTLVPGTSEQAKAQAAGLPTVESDWDSESERHEPGQDHRHMGLPSALTAPSLGGDKPKQVAKDNTPKGSDWDSSDVDETSEHSQDLQSGRSQKVPPGKNSAPLSRSSSGGSDKKSPPKKEAASSAPLNNQSKPKAAKSTNNLELKINNFETVKVENAGSRLGSRAGSVSSTSSTNSQKSVRAAQRKSLSSGSSSAESQQTKVGKHELQELQTDENNEKCDVMLETDNDAAPKSSMSPAESDWDSDGNPGQSPGASCFRMGLDSLGNPQNNTTNISTPQANQRHDQQAVNPNANSVDDENEWDSDVDPALTAGLMGSMGVGGYRPSTTPAPTDYLQQDGKAEESLSQWDSEPAEASHTSHTKVESRWDTDDDDGDPVIPMLESMESDEEEEDEEKGQEKPPNGIIPSKQLTSAIKMQETKNGLPSWDSSPTESRTTVPILAPPRMFQNAPQDSPWDSDMEGELAPTKSNVTPRLPSTPPPKTAPDVNVEKGTLQIQPHLEDLDDVEEITLHDDYVQGANDNLDDTWDSEDERNELTLHEELTQSIRAANLAQLKQNDSEILPDTSQSANRGTAALSTNNVRADDDSKWDSTDDGIPTPRQEGSQSKPVVVRGSMFTADDTDDDSDLEEEEESTWEKERKENALQRQRSAEREQQWESDYKQRQEQHRLEAQEELRKEREEEERLRKQAAEEEWLEEEERIHKEEEEEEEEQKLKETKVRNRQDAVRLRQEAERNKDQTSKNKEALTKKTEASAMTTGNMLGLGALSDEDDEEEEEERSQLIRLRREQAEQELAAAKARQELINGFHDNQSLPDDEEDTFNDLEVPDLDPVMNSAMAYTNGAYGHSTLDEDMLSYSSTEQEASVHDQLCTSQGPGGHPNLSFNSDTVNVVRLQDQLREARRLLEKERSTRTSMENKRKNLEKEKSELIAKLEETTRAKSHLEQNKIDIDAKMRTLQYEVAEETEKSRNAEALLSKTKEQLSRKEDQYTNEVDAKQKVELSMRNLQMELRTTLSNINQLEEEKEDMIRQLQHEKNSRQLQEQINDEQQRLSDQLRATENAAQPARRDELAAAINRLEEADENRKVALDSVEKLSSELYATKMELDRQKARFRDDHSLLTAENDDLALKVGDLKSDIKLQEEALAHATMQYNIQLSQLKTDNTVLASSFDKEHAAREKLDMEVESLRSRLSSTSSELEKSQAARSELERNNHKEHEEWNRLLDRRDVELNSLKETNQNLSHRLGAAEAKVSALENELHISNATLIERTNQFSTIQRELDQRRGNQENMDESFRKDREDNVRMTTKMESLTERLTSLQHENLTLKQQLDEVRLRDLSRDQGDQGEKINTMLTSLRTEHDKGRTALEEKNAMLQEQIAHLRDEARSSESRHTNLEQHCQRTQTELTEASKRLSMAEASLNAANRSKEQAEHERISLKAEVNKLETRLGDSVDKLAESNAKASQLKERLDQAERNMMTTSQQLMTQSTDVNNIARNKSELEVEMHRLELENAKLESALKHETDHVQSLQKELNDSTQVRNTMEALLTNLKTANAHLDEKLTNAQWLQDELVDLKTSNAHLKQNANEAAMSRTLATQDADDSRQLWETEVKGRSKLGLRIARLEREKQESVAQVDEEKRKTRKAMELKRNTEVKLEMELQKATQLQKEVATLKAHLKAAKKRLRELDTSDNRINILNTDFNNERREMERTIITTRRQLEDVQHHLSSEIETKEKLESKTRQLTAELKNLTHMEKTHNKLERAKRKLEEDLVSYKNHISSNYVERSELERIKADLEAKSRLELNTKLEEVNNYLEEQALTRQHLDTMRDSNESKMRKDFERTQKDLMDELNKLRGSYRETTTSVESKEFEAKKFQDLYESERKLRERLADKLEHATEKAAKAQMFMDRHFTQSAGGTMQNNWMTSSASSPLLLGKSAPGHGVNDLSQKIRAELNRSIAKHLEKCPQIDISLPPRSFDDINLGASSFNKASADYLEVLKKNYMLS